MAQLDLQLDADLVVALEALAVKRGVTLETLINACIWEGVQADALNHALAQTNTTAAERVGSHIPD